jgi:hypothetical protein
VFCVLSFVLAACDMVQPTKSAFLVGIIGTVLNYRLPFCLRMMQPKIGKAGEGAGRYTQVGAC